MSDFADVVITDGEFRDDERHFTVQWKAFSHHFDFVAKEGWRQDDGSICYMTMASGVDEPCDFAAGDPLIDGSIKWDGCSHYIFGDENGYLHLCGGADMRRLVVVMETAWRLAGEHLPSLDKDCAQYKEFTS